MSVSVAFLGECLVAVYAGERSEACVSARMVLGTTKLGELFETDVTLHKLCQSVCFGISSKNLSEGSPDDVCILLLRHFYIDCSERNLYLCTHISGCLILVETGYVKVLTTIVFHHLWLVNFLAVIGRHSHSTIRNTLISIYKLRFKCIFN